MKNWTDPPTPLHSKTTLLVGDSQNMYYLNNFLNETTKTWDITIVPEMTNLISLVKSKNLYIYMLLTDMEIEAVYVFRNTCTHAEKGKKILDLIASHKSNAVSKTVFIQGFKNALWAIILDNPSYHYLSIEDISDNKYIIDNIQQKTHPMFTYPTAYFFYNYARSPFKSHRAFIVN